MHAIVFRDLMQLPPAEGLKINDKFFRILNKIRFGIIDDEVRCTLEERWRQYNPQHVMWNTTYLSSLRDEAAALNHAVLSGMPSENPIFVDEAAALNHAVLSGMPLENLVFVSKAEDFENGVRLQHSEHSKVFNTGTNFASSVVCTVGTKVIFLTNSMLSERGISNGSIGVITNLLPDDEVEAAFPTKDGIQLPIINAFALTIHKVQGLSLPAVTVVLNSNIFSDGQAYVVLNRRKDLEQVYLTHCDFEAIKADPEAIAEYERLEAKAEQLNRPNSH
ncbi:hypothetical protein MAA_10556 [Metarhizium robertsii ARSEF 23]|uniref:Uncharacterized protein n=1 Tax=Metarhizium robertsii (strain ARSEF 23 / ATCC MYA-3075) TaxID=655844 RepID=E9FE57_METRA|nr:uncharacterized protein MAA_10556 [Metarhizium robertsii ARSEF 23]EFY93982.1 hypothetical protein MAA_10556 [Metarhizium robertsii ARSEF 23]